MTNKNPSRSLDGAVADSERALVSIVLCCHNREDYLRATLESVLAQDYSPIELIVMDDGSTDRSAEIVREVAPQARYFFQESQGIAVARTNASAHAKGKYIAYHDDDDLMPPERITTLLRLLQDNPGAVLATGDYELIDAQSQRVGHRWLPLKEAEEGTVTLIEDGHLAILWPKVPAVPHTTLFRKADGEKVGWFDHDFRYACSDADFLARLGQLGAVVYVREVVSLYRRGHAQIWSDDVRTSISRIQLWSKHLEIIGSSRPELRDQVRSRLLPVMIRLDLNARRGKVEPHYQWPSWRSTGLTHLDFASRLKYFWRTLAINPIKVLLNRG